MLEIGQPTQEEYDELPYYCRIKRYQCENCEAESYEKVKYSKQTERKKCPVCNKMKLEQIVEAPNFTIDNGPVTVGQLADRNTAKMGKYEKQERRHKEKSYYDNRVQNYMATSEDSVFSDPEKKRKVMRLTPDEKQAYLRGEKKL